MKIYQIYRILLHVGIGMLFIGFNFRVMHWPGGGVLWYLVYALTLAYVSIGIYLVMREAGKSTLEKAAWAIGLFMLPPIFGLIFYHSEIKKKSPAPNIR